MQQALPGAGECWRRVARRRDRKSTRLNSSHDQISYAVFCLKKKKRNKHQVRNAPRSYPRTLISDQPSDLEQVLKQLSTQGLPIPGYETIHLSMSILRVAEPAVTL